MTPHMEALAYRIWAYATPREWDCSYAEIADGTGISYGMVAHVTFRKRWTHRVPQGGGDSILASARRAKYADPNYTPIDQLML